MQQKYEADIQKRQSALMKYSQSANLLGSFKLVCLVIMGFSLYQAWVQQFPPLWLLLLFAEIIIFMIACNCHTKVLEGSAYETGRIKISQKNISRLTGDWCSFMDTGEEFGNYEHNYASDLDIVGKRSLFQYLNSTNTYYGRISLAEDLLNPHYSPKEIKLRQNAIEELKNDYAWTSHMEYHFMKIGIDPSFPKLISEWKSKKKFFKKRWICTLLNVSRMITCLSVLYAIVSRNDLSFIIAGSFLIFQLSVWRFGLSKIEKHLQVMNQLPYKMSRYHDIVTNIVQHNFVSPKLQELKETVTPALESIPKLAAITEHIAQCQNGLACLLLNAFFLWDYKNIVDLDQWKQRYGDSAETWFLALGELESLMSFSNLPRNCSNVCIPTVITQNNELHVKHMGHPLLSNGQRVCNDLDINNNILIISGSNMSGKTTFMRTVGMNMILAMAGSYVCARQMTFSIMKVVTSMRISDVLTEGISTFYAELKRIKRIIDSAKTDSHQLFLIDEIFRGTNSVDRLIGAEGVLKKLYALELCGIITTHDLEICKLENTYNKIKNYSFYEHYANGEIYFDYKIKEGISRTTNAEYLLKKVGILSLDKE